MWRVGEHVDGLDRGDTIIGVEVVEVAGLGGRIARDVDDAPWGSAEDGFHDVRMHASPRRVGDDHIRTAMLGDEVVGEDILHVTGIEKGVRDAVDLGVHLSILDGLWYIFDADDLACFPGYEIGDGACTGVKIVD